MPDLADGDSVEVKGSGAKPYVLKNVGGVYSCSCPAWRNAGGPIDRRTCKHLKALRGEAVELARIGAPAGAAGAPKSAVPKASKAGPKTSSEDGDEAGEQAPPLLLAHVYEPDVDPTGWWMSEKLDGVRAYWDGKRFVSRLGNVYHAPEWFTAGLPEFTLDGELWLDRKAFQRTVSVVRRQDGGDAWRQIRFLVFDAPGHEGDFEARMRHYHGELERRRPAFASALAHEICTGAEHLQRELMRVEALGGEGLMLRRPGSRYEVGRSHTLLKVKTFHDDEARVVGHQAGTGKHKGRLGALLVELRDGTRFALGTGMSDADRNDPPAVGTIVTFRYQELSDGGVPRFPSFVGVRHDVAWTPGAAPAKKASR
ncbi:DNA ligase [Nannocystis pusilla]|uniref:DNA ligase n=1 Tax=Nannocystis pusilla TaxID=889268 RepID=UPI003DA45B67